MGEMDMRATSVPRNYRTDTGQIDIARLKQDVSIVQIAGMVTKLKPAGTQLKGLCPLHHEHTASFFVSEARGLYHCFGCGRGGDVIDLVRRIGGRSFVESCEWLVGSERTCPPEARISVAEARAKRQANIHRAKVEWHRGIPIQGTVVEDYLTSRGIIGRVPGCIRHSWVPRYWRDDGSEGSREPALIAACQDVSGKVVGIQRTFLDSEGRKARRGSPRLSLGQIRGSALRFGPVRPEIMLAQSVEDALSLTRMFPGETVWAALGDANLAHVALPEEVRSVMLCGDTDEPGRAAVERAQEAYETIGINVRALFPRAGKDFNSELLLLHI
jgi:phage/plasmid primase-like uncharacterized protein